MRAAVLVVLAAVCFGSTGTAVALGAPGASPLSVGAARVLVGGALLALLAGAAGAAGGAGGAGSSTSPAGLMASLGAGTSYAVFALVTKALLDRGWTPATSTGAVFGGAAALSAPVLLATDLTWLDGPAPWGAVLWLGAVTTALAYALFARGLRHLPAATVATLTLAEPLTATLLGLVVLHEHLGSAQVVALLLLAGALAVLAAPARRRLAAATAVPS